MTTPAVSDPSTLPSGQQPSPQPAPAAAPGQDVLLVPVGAPAAAAATSAAPDVPTVPAPSPADARLAQLEQENARLTRDAETRRQAEEEAGLHSTVSQWAVRRAQEIEQATGYSPEAAAAIAKAEGAQHLANYQLAQERRSNAAEVLSRKYGAPKATLMGFNDLPSMQAYAMEFAQTQGPLAQKVQNLEAQLAQLRKGQVPAQNFDQPGGTGGSTAAATWAAYGRGTIPWSPQVQKAGQSLGAL